MNPSILLWTVLIGLGAGFLTGRKLRGRGFGLGGNIIIGILGALIGGYVVSAGGIPFGAGSLEIVGSAALGTGMLLLVMGLIQRA